MVPKKKPAKRNASADEDSDDPISHMNRGYAGVAGFFDTDIPASLYGLWRRDVAQLMRETGIFGPQRAGTDYWSTLYWHAAGLPTIAPRGKINYCTDKEIIHAVNILCQDVAKKVCSGETARDQAISSAEAAHASHYPRDPPPALSDKPLDLGSPNKKIVMAPPNKTKKGALGQKTSLQANDDLLAQLSKRLGGLWAPATAYRPVGAPPQGEGQPNNIQYELDPPEEESDDQDSDEAMLLPSSWKRPRRKCGSRSSSPTKPQDKRAKAVKKEPAKPVDKGKGKAVSNIQSVDKGKRAVHEPSGPMAKASSHAGPSRHNTGLARGPVGTRRVMRSTSKMRNPKTTSSAAPKTFPSSPLRLPNTLSHPLYKALEETHVAHKSPPDNATPTKKVEEILGSFNDATCDIPIAEDDNDKYEDPESSDDDSQNKDTDYEEDS
ncbi:hypothetical protein L211DRAFT_854504 [Terfezia boudieri ATCC MYA-4762]|uniref:Uncharacterized protein n=1 Tax=Terfezia boudieri ATCC MYA-4762 TaxID=1051890 RepID=A0A3N4L9B8_9PEZI|nr:hypothetical protein L211DRAFT_854504 [Terfezia boudieri ATCC MYA-4762]